MTDEMKLCKRANVGLVQFLKYLYSGFFFSSSFCFPMVTGHVTCLDIATDPGIATLCGQIV